MLLTILGAILILFPLLLIFYFKNKILGFLYIFVGASVFHLLLALTISWKDLVIGAATNNYPLDSKAGIITNHLVDFFLFMDENCANKYSQAKLFNLSYVYSFPFKCDNFLELGHSREGLYLYKFKP